MLYLRGAPGDHGKSCDGGLPSARPGPPLLPFWGYWGLKPNTIVRREHRVPMAIAVQLAGMGGAHNVESTFTENVSANGARVYSGHSWRKNDRLFLSAVPAGFKAHARVAYCQPIQGQGFAVGLEFLDKSAGWVIDSSKAASI